MTAARAALLGVLGAATLAGCGLGAGSTPRDVGLIVTTDFGTRLLHAAGPLKDSGQETAMSLLLRNYKVATSDGGGFVQSVDGLGGGHEAGQPVDWFYYVNGVEATKGAAATDVRSGDRIWWDRHDWSQTESVPAVVGSFPEPFLDGIEGKRLPVRVECVVVSTYACQTVAAHLRAVDVQATVTTIADPSASAPQALRVLVAPWASIANVLGAQSLEHGPRASGVYARFSSDGQTLTLLDQQGDAAATLYGGAGVIAATRHGENPPVWLVTGTDERGVQLAARAFDESTLQDRFAVAVGPNGVLALPDEAAGR
jgi:hypothetical protein